MNIVHDYNGVGYWSETAIQSRYAALASRMGVAKRLDLAPATHVRGNTLWIYPAMDRVIDGIKALHRDRRSVH